MKNEYIHYYVEGEDEEVLLKALKTELRCIKPGKITRFNVVERELNLAYTRMLKPKTKVVLVFDTDTGNDKILARNISFLKSCSVVSEVLLVCQVNKLEDELCRSCNIAQIKELTASKSNSDFKSDFIKCKNVGETLKKHGFDISKMWNKAPKGAFEKYGNDGEKIKE